MAAVGGGAYARTDPARPARNPLAVRPRRAAQDRRARFEQRASLRRIRHMQFTVQPATPHIHLGFRMVSAHDQPDKDGIADRESIGLKEIRSDFESGAFWGAVETPAAGRAYAARCATRPRAQHA